MFVLCADFEFIFLVCPRNTQSLSLLLTTIRLVLSAGDGDGTTNEPINETTVINNKQQWEKKIRRDPHCCNAFHTHTHTYCYSLKIISIDEKLSHCINIRIFFFYPPADGIDGKQARRIGLSGPLGELFDHGLDSYTAPLIPACLYSIFGRGGLTSIPPIRMYYIVWMVLFNFILSHFEKYNTGVLYLPWGYDFGMWVRTYGHLPFTFTIDKWRTLTNNIFVIIVCECLYYRALLYCSWPRGLALLNSGSGRLCHGASRWVLALNFCCTPALCPACQWSL